MAKGQQGGRGQGGAPPRWFGEAPGPDGRIPGLPSFVTLDWIRTWSSVSPTAMRRLHDSIETPAWWPERCPSAEEIPYVIGASMREPAFFADLVRRHSLAAQSRLTAFGRNSLFAPLIDLGDEAPREARLLVEFLEEPDTAPALLASLTEEERAALDDPSPGSPLTWLRLHFPEAADAVGAALPDMPPQDQPTLTETLAPPPPAAVPSAPVPVPAAPPPAAAGPAPGRPAPDDVDETGLRAEVRDALSQAAQAAASALSSGGFGRADVAPLLLSALRVSRGSRRLDRYLTQPVEAGDILAAMASAAARVAAATKGTAPEIPAAPFPVARPAVEGLRSLATTLASGAADIESLLAAMQDQGRRLAEAADIDIAVEISNLGNRIRESARTFWALLADALSEAARARVEPAAAAAPRPRPAAPVAPAAPQGIGPVPEELPLLSRVVLDLGAHDDARMAEAIDLCLEFVGEWPGRFVPPGSNAFEAADDETGQTLRIAGAPGAWSFLWTFPDQDDTLLPWSLEGSLADIDGRLFLSTTLRTAEDDAPMQRRAPDLARRAVERLGPLDAGRVLSGAPLAMSSLSDYGSLVFDPARRLPVVAASLTTSGEGSILDLAELAHALAGVAHVVTVPDALSRELTDKYGASWSVYDRRVRIILPGAKPEHADAPRHKTFKADEIARAGAASFSARLLDMALAGAKPVAVPPGFVEVAALAGASAATHDAAHPTLAPAAPGAGDAAALAEREAAMSAMEDALAAMEARLAEVQARADEAAAEAQAASSERDEVRARNHALSLRNEALSTAVRDRDTPAAAPPRPPANIEELLAFAQAEMGPGVLVMPKAIRETRKTSNVDVQRLYKALVAMRDVYVPMRLGKLSLDDCEKELKRLGMVESKVTSDPNKNHNKVTLEGQTYTLERHLKWGVGTSQASMARIYFFWDAKGKRAVIGHMPTHLPAP